MTPAHSDAVTAAAYDARAAEYVRLAGAIEQMDARDAAIIDSWARGTTGGLLDAGCGPGHWTALVAGIGRDVQGIDLSAALVSSARRRHPGIRFDIGSFRDLPLGAASLGGVLAWYSLIHIPPADVAPVLAEFARVIAPGGELLLGFFDGTPQEPFAHAIAPAWFWSVDALAEMLDGAGLDVISHDTRRRAPGEVSARPHGSLTARRR